MSRPVDPIEIARCLIAARRRRARSLPCGIFGEPAWDILLDLFVSAADGRDVALNSACVASGVPTTTAMRCIGALHQRGLIDQRADKSDGRRTLLFLTPLGLAKLRAALLDFAPLASASVGHSAARQAKPLIDIRV